MMVHLSPVWRGAIMTLGQVAWIIACPTEAVLV